MKRREFITLLGGAAAAWPLAARAQQPMPVIGFLGASTPETNLERMRAFHLGLKETGYVEGDNVTILYRWAQNHVDRLPDLVADLARRQVAVLATYGNAPALAAKAATTTIPIVFSVTEDPVQSGLVVSLARPGGNLTGINTLSTELAAKRLGLLHELVPGAVKVAVLVDPASPPTETTLRDVEIGCSRCSAANSGFQRQHQPTRSMRLSQHLRANGPTRCFVGPGFLFTSRRVQLVHLATLHKVPATYSQRQFAEIGGLMSYGTAFGYPSASSASMPVAFSRAPSPRTCRWCSRASSSWSSTPRPPGCSASTVPPSLLARADEVIE